MSLSNVQGAPSSGFPKISLGAPIYGVLNVLRKIIKNKKKPKHDMDEVLTPWFANPACADIGLRKASANHLGLCLRCGVSLDDS